MLPMPVRRWILVVWACFAVRLLFYAAMLPLWEGYDEWAHFAVVRRIVVQGELLPSRQAPVPKDVEISLQLAPVPWEMRNQPPPAVTQDDFWQLDAAQRHRREQAMGAMPPEWQSQDGTLTAYEALQPPLYYWLMALPLAVCRLVGMGLAAQMLVLRFVSSLLASMIVPVVFLIAARIWTDSRVALGCAAIVALMPGLALDVARVGNDSLAVSLFSVLTFLLIQAAQGRLTSTLAVSLGVVLGLGLLTKAYFLTAIPAILLVLVWRRAKVREVSIAAAIAVVLSGWWYVRNLATTETLSGLSESVMLRDSGAVHLWAQVGAIHWPKAIDSIFLSHLYFGGWSSLTVRSWMYHLFYVVIAAAFGGICFSLSLSRNRKDFRAFIPLLALYAFFWLGQLYNVVLLSASKGLGGSMGWYMYAVVAAQTLLCVAGLRAILPTRVHRWIPLAGALLFALLDLYTVHAVAIPYYTGTIHHRANGTLAALHASEFAGIGLRSVVERLTVFKALGPITLVSFWILYIMGTAGSIFSTCGAKDKNPSRPHDAIW